MQRRRLVSLANGRRASRLDLCGALSTDCASCLLDEYECRHDARNTFLFPGAFSGRYSVATQAAGGRQYRPPLVGRRHGVAGARLVALSAMLLGACHLACKSSNWYASPPLSRLRALRARRCHAPRHLRTGASHAAHWGTEAVQIIRPVVALWTLAMSSGSRSGRHRVLTMC